MGDAEPLLLGQEELVAGGSLGLSLENLCKTYGAVRAVDNLSVHIKPGIVTCLLGENGILSLSAVSDTCFTGIYLGSGKSTTIGMLIGQIAPTAGTITCDGVDMINNMDAVREHMGVCLQHDVFWAKLTVLEHFELYARLKGIPDDKSLEDSVEAVGLECGQVADTLSGGQQRKLCLALALIGQPRLVILDEISSGVDVNFQLELWHMLQEFQRRSSATVLLTTHEMLEAETVGTEIIIIRAGASLRAHGTVQELAERFGVGYQLVFNTQRDADAAEPLVHALIPQGNTRSTSHRGEVLMRLAHADVAIMPELCRKLDEMRLSYRLIAGSLRDVFLEVVDAPEGDALSLSLCLVEWC
jgi:ABC-type multidrug transport system ATPase subunit